MAKLPGSFNAEQHEDMNSFEPIPAGEYEAKVTKSELKATSDKQGQMLVLTFEILRGDHKGRICWSRLNLVNKSEKAVEIANKELATLCRACGKINIDESEELHGIPISIKVKVTKETPQYPAGNAITNYKPLAGLASPSKPLTEATPSKPSEPSKPSKPSKPLFNFDE